jgi:membrane-associated phospholipid phosphatase
MRFVVDRAPRTHAALRCITRLRAGALEESMTQVSHRHVSHRSIFAVATALLGFVASPAAAQPAPPAPPAPDAPPEKVEQAKDTAKAAQLTPIVPSPGEPTRPAFQLYAEIDLPVLTVGVVFAGVRFVRTQKAFCAPLCDRNDLNALDRTTAGRWSPDWLLASNVGLLATSVGAAALLADDEGALNALNDALVIAESAMTATAAASIMTIAAGRPRPFLYGETAPLSDRNGTDASNSFLSSHAAVGFAIATSTYMAMRRLHPRSQLPYAVLGLGLAGASFVATSRVLAGEHFITDAIGGALVGSSIGVLVSSLHSSPVTIVPVTGDHQHGIGVQGRF